MPLEGKSSRDGVGVERERRGNETVVVWKRNFVFKSSYKEGMSTSWKVDVEGVNVEGGGMEGWKVERWKAEGWKV